MNAKYQYRITRFLYRRHTVALPLSSFHFQTRSGTFHLNKNNFHSILITIMLKLVSKGKKKEGNKTCM